VGCSNFDSRPFHFFNTVTEPGIIDNEPLQDQNQPPGMDYDPDLFVSHRSLALV
jgi:hypothetical protein